MMIEKLNERLGGGVVKEIVLKSGQVDRHAVTTSSQPEEMLRKKRLTPRQLSFIDEQSAAIYNPETREAFIALMKASFENARSS